jgi:tetratricopeptide (TPR) repeat protein
MTIAQRPRRRLQVRALLALAKSAPIPRDACTYAEQAGDVLFAFLKRPLLARIAYSYAASRSEDPSALMGAIREIDQKQKATLNGTQDPVLERLQEIMANATDVADDNEKQELRIQAADLLIADRPDFESYNARVNLLLPWLCVDASLREEALSALRDRERYDYIIHLLKACLPRVWDGERRGVLLKLGHALRFGRGDLAGAADCFEELIGLNENDRESWGELLECLDDSGDHERLVLALQKRIGLTQGLEQRQLIRQREDVLKGLGRSSESAESVL